MLIRGSLSEATLADVLQLLALGQKTGVLSLAREDSFGAVHFDRGAIAHAAIVNHRDRLGDRLVRAGALDADALAMLEAEADIADDARLARRLHDTGVVEPELLHREYRVLIEEIVCQLFTWSTGSFAFEPVQASEAALLALPADALLMEAARRVDEWTQIAKKIPSLDLLFEVDGARLRQSGLAVTPEQARIASWLDGTHDVATLIERSGLGEFVVGKALYGLVTAGFAQCVGRSAARREPAPESRVTEHRNLGIAFARTGMLEEARREFRRVLELRADDQGARYQLALVHLRLREWSDAIGLLRDALARSDATPALHQALAFAHECAGDLDAAEASLADAVHRGARSDPRIALSQAVIALRRGDLARAEERLATARTWWGACQPSAVWFHHAGLAAALGGDLVRASRVLEEGIMRHPHATVLHNNLAVVQERQALHESAVRTLEHALLERSTLPHLHKNLGDCLYGAHRFEDAHEAYERVVRLDPAHGPDTWLRLGNIRYRLGDLAHAREAWEAAVALDPEHAIARANLERTERLAPAPAVAAGPAAGLGA
jgi:tetratricopeptide (TPR) repeat protein